MQWRAFPLHPETPQAGRSLAALFAGQPIDLPAMLAKLRQVAGELDLPFGERTMTFNSRLAQELGKWAEEQGVGDAFHRAVFEAYFRDGQNIARHRVLMTICKRIGLDAKAASRILTRRSYADSVDRDWQLSRRLGIRAVPTFLFGEQRLVGAQPYEALEKTVLSPFNGSNGEGPHNGRFAGNR